MAQSPHSGFDTTDIGADELIGTDDTSSEDEENSRERSASHQESSLAEPLLNGLDGDLRGETESGDAQVGSAVTGNSIVKSRDPKYWIPRVVLTSDILFGIASGTTIKFFPLFFRYESGMTPAQVNWIYVISP